MKKKDTQLDVIKKSIKDANKVITPKPNAPKILITPKPTKQ